MPAVPGNPYSIYLLEQHSTFPSFFGQIFYLFCSTYINCKPEFPIMPHSWYWSFPSFRRFQIITGRNDALSSPTLMLSKERIYLPVKPFFPEWGSPHIHNPEPPNLLTQERNIISASHFAPCQTGLSIPQHPAMSVIKIALIRILVAHYLFYYSCDIYDKCLVLLTNGWGGNYTQRHKLQNHGRNHFSSKAGWLHQGWQPLAAVEI